MSKRTFQEMISEAKGDQEIDAPEPSTAGAPQGGRSGKYSRETANKKGALLQLRKEKTKLTADVLLSPQGFTKLAGNAEKLFAQFPRSGPLTDAEAVNELGLLMKLCEEWAKNLVPSISFDDFIKRFAKVDNHLMLQDFRRNIFYPPPAPEPEAAAPAPPTVAAAAQPLPSATVATNDTGDKRNQNAKSPEDAEAIKKKIEENKRQALLRRQQKQQEKASQSSFTQDLLEKEKVTETKNEKEKKEKEKDDDSMEDLFSEISAAAKAQKQVTEEAPL